MLIMSTVCHSCMHWPTGVHQTQVCPAFLSVCLPACLPACLSVCPQTESVCVHACLPHKVMHKTTCSQLYPHQHSIQPHTSLPMLSRPPWVCLPSVPQDPSA